MGRNGAGKTTTFSMILGLVAPGRRPRLPQRTRTSPTCRCTCGRGKGLVLLPQEPSAFRKLTVAENLLAVLETPPVAAGLPGAPGSSEALEEFGLDKLAGALALTLVRRRAAPPRDRPGHGHWTPGSSCSTSRSRGSTPCRSGTSRRSSGRSGPGASASC
ncbi:MAG: ATP-binding cassette domain-containing protein [Ignavibacteriales bacterium]|nr:ATP-binding cassette domain-containing protein [Ignavibacteriales bacterium]